MFGDFGGGDSDVGICGDEGGNVLAGLPLGTEFIDFVADHPDKSLDREHFGAQAGSIAEGFLCADSLFQGVRFHGCSFVIVW